MELPATQRSIRKMVLLLLGLCLGIFTIILFSILYGTMPQMLLQAETKYLNDQINVTSGLLDDAIENAYWMADDIGIWDETVRFARGENPEFMENNWPESSLLEAYSFDFILITDSTGQELYADYFNHIEGVPYEAPAGFSAYVGEQLAAPVLSMYQDGPHQAGSIHELGRGGIFFYRGEAYYAATMPILNSRKSGEAPAGTVTLGNILNNAFFQQLTHFNAIRFDMLMTVAERPEEGGQAEDASINRIDENTVHGSLMAKDIFGNPVRLRLTDSRTVYREGRGAINAAALLLVLALLLFACTLYIATRRTVFHPIERLSRDIAEIGPQGRLAPEAYSNTREFQQLCLSINDTLTRLGESTDSLDILRQILNNIDANIYVADPVTDEILFVNAHMQGEYPGQTLIGERCYAALHARDTRCETCPTQQLLDAPGTVLTWQSHNPQTQRYYQNTDCMIGWFGGKQARLEHSVDITESRLTAESLKRRLEQQALMTTITQGFISSSDMSASIADALRLTGEFMDACKIIIATVSRDGRRIQFAHGWSNSVMEGNALQIAQKPFLPGNELYDAFIIEKRPYLAWDDLSQAEEFAFMRDFGVCAFITAPIMVDGNLRGIITIDECRGPREWSPSDIQLARTLSGIISGVFAREEAEKDLIRMSSLVDTSPQFINYISNDGSFVYCNPGAQKILGYTAKDMIGKSISMIMSEETYAHVTADILPEILRLGELEFVLPIVSQNGQVRTMQFNAFSTNLQPAGIGAIATDITEQKRLERELIAAKELAESSSHAKSDFLSRMSHEMRTPMGAIIGMTNIAKASDDPEKKEYCLDKIQDASNHLLGVINDILDMSKIEAQKFELSYTEFNFEKMLMRVVDVINFRVEEKKQTLLVKLDPDIPAYLVCDEQRIAQVITNFLSNAVKFTPEQGEISLEATKLREEGEDDVVIRVDVKDTGIGISEEQQGRLFRSFEQADGGIARRFGGTGLGLAISKSIIDLMGGEVSVESTLGQGSTFSFTVRMRRGSSVPQRCLREGIDWSNLRVLVVDDSPDVLEYFRSIAASIGLSCATAESGEEAIRLITEQADNPFSIVFVDWQMPNMNGVELTRIIKTKLQQDMVVIMISVSEWSEIEQEATQAGVNRFVPKPLFPSLIVDCINQCMGIVPQEADAAQITPQDVTQFAGRHILLAEDIDINREIVMSLLEDTGVIIDCAENGRQAVEMFSAAPGRYDMIFMDIHMPEMDGYEATRRIRALDIPEAKAIPIVAMTANVFREDVERCLAAGMNGHIGKPLNIEDMFGKMRMYLPKQ